MTVTVAPLDGGVLDTGPDLECDGVDVAFRHPYPVTGLAILG